MATKNQIITDITNKFRGYRYSKCYVGLTSDVQQRLFVDHAVPRQTGHYISRTADTNTIAREVEKHFLDAGMDGGGGGGNYRSKIAYAYKKIPYVTKQ